ncbi:glycoside hydrolase family 2 protein [Bacteroidota bacterium]
MTKTSFVLFLALISVSTNAQVRQQISLNDDWLVKSLEESESIPADLPGNFKKPGSGWYPGDMPKQVQELILEKGELPDPSIGDNAAKWVPVFQKDWLYCKRFKTPDNYTDVSICFLGLDTEVDIYLNGQKIAYANNMFRRWSIPIQNYLNPAGKENTLMLRFSPPTSGLTAYGSLSEQFASRPQLLIRKSWADFNSYLGANPNFLKMGIFDEVYLDLLPKSYFGEVYVRTELFTDQSSANVIIKPDLAAQGKFRISYELLSPDGSILAENTIEAKEEFSIPVENPELWWPMQYGDQPLYSLKMQLLDSDEIMDKSIIRFGIRKIEVELSDETTGEPRFGFRINGKMIFVNGACWAPLDGFTHSWEKERADKLLDLMVLGNLNFLRIWGEGSIPGKSLFEKCDEEGIVIWMDFMAGASMQFPVDNELFRRNISADIEDEIKRLRNHPSIAIWCGGNEHYKLYKSNDGDNTEPVGRQLFQKIMPELVSKYDPQRYFQPSSPWGGDSWPHGNYPLEGDFHDYSSIRFQPLATVPLFTTEICMVSPYSIHNMQRFMSEDDLWPDNFQFTIDKPGKIAWPPGWEKHGLRTAWEKIGSIQDYLDIQNAGDACRVFGTAHGEYLKERYERQRRGVPDGQPDGNRRSWGAAIWRLNDTWPMIYMSAIDYYLEPKIPYYFLKRACEPVLISFEQTPEQISVWLVNDSPDEIADSLFVELWTFDGKMKKQITRSVNLASSSSKRIVDLAFEFHEIRKRDEFLVARWGDHEVTHLLWPEKFLHLRDAEISVKWEKAELVLNSDRFVKDVELYMTNTSGAVFSDNYFNLIPGEEKRIEIIDSKNGNSIRIKGLNSEITNIRIN